MLAVVELLVAADVEAAFITELNGALPAHGFLAKSGTKIPNPLSDEFIRLLVSGGTDRDLVTDQPSVTVEYFATSEVRAERGAAYARAVIEAAGRSGSLGGVVCYGTVTFGRPVNLPMPTVPDRFRYTFTISADLRKSTV